ncbi:acyltransferase [bacterium]|nr:acyltransferase [candidate division CSSED10-310 bacterium]
MSHEKPPQKLYFPFLDALSGFAILRVVFLHSLASYFVIIFQDVNPNNFTHLPAWAKISDLILRHSVPIFVLLSGFKYEISCSRHPNRIYREYVAQRLYRLGIPLLVWTVLYYYLKALILPGILNSNPEYINFPFPSLKNWIVMLSGIDTPAYPLWFLSMLLIINMIYPVAVKTVSIIYRFVFTQNFSTQLHMKRYWLHTIFFSILYLLSSLNEWHRPWNYCEFLLVFHIGVGLYHWKNFFNLQKRHILLIIFLWLITISFAILKYNSITAANADAALKISLPLAMIMLFAAMKNVVSFRPLVKLGQLAWPLYILHEPIILFSLSRIFYLNLGLTDPYYFILPVLLTTFVSLLMIFLLKKIHLYDLLF